VGRNWKSLVIDWKIQIKRLLSSIFSLLSDLCAWVGRNWKTFGTCGGILFLGFLTYLRYQDLGRLGLVLAGSTIIAALLPVIVLTVRLSVATEKGPRKGILKGIPEGFILLFLLFLLLGAYLISYRGRAEAEAVVEYAFFLLTVAVVLKFLEVVLWDFFYHKIPEQEKMPQ
jgi:uncharacterized membrane protein